jgi:hypothetical protein
MSRVRIEVDRIDDDTFRVTVSERGGRTVHTVTVDPSSRGQLTDGVASPEDLVRRSFEFLLEREPKESILASFSLSVIRRYFPEYDTEIARRIRRG